MPALQVCAILEDKLYLKAELCKGCSFCVEFCPKRVLFVSSAFNAKGYHPPGVYADGKCSNCKLCELLCPEFAIYSTDYSRNAGRGNGAGGGQEVQ